MKYRFTRVFTLLVLVSSLIIPAHQVKAQDVNLSVSTHVKGFSLEFPFMTTGTDYPGENLLTTIRFGNNTPLHITEKNGLESETVSAPTISAVFTTREPISNLVFDILPTSTPTATPTPTNVPTPTAALTSTPSSNITVQLSAGGLNADKLFDMSNAYRQSKGMAPFTKDDRSCQLAASRAPEINTEITAGAMHSGLRARNLNYWNSENIITMQTEEGAFNWWINDTIHREAIEGNYTYSCVACSGNACAQEFTNFQPK